MIGHARPARDAWWCWWCHFDDAAALPLAIAWLE